MLDSAASDWSQAEAIINETRRRRIKEWTMTHALFAAAQGFMLQSSEGTEERLNLPTLRGMIKTKKIFKPSISEVGLRSSSKGDWAIKLIALLQTLWFATQMILRGVQLGHVTALEVMTCAFIFCSIFSYAF